MNELSSGARALLKQYREDSEIFDQPDASVLEGIESSLAERPGGDTTAEPTETTPRAAAWVAWGAVAAASVATIWVWTSQPAVGVVVQTPVSSAVDRVVEASQQRARISGHALPATESVAPPTLSPPTPRAAPPTAPPAPALADPPVPPRRVRSPARAPDAPAPDDSLQRELELLRQARAALREGRSAGAKASLRAHARSYPQGQLSEERDALRVVVRCTDGESKTGREAFEASHPSSHHLPAIGAACDAKKKAPSVTDGDGGGQ